ncbi:hypothetical protein ACPV4U_25135, partial [Vibrio alginolyticus]|uniref:hypothetical protein n=1 Tax=Vibrio alginolyticus TaxID=663 RepID=UPI0040697ECB
FWLGLVFTVVCLSFVAGWQPLSRALNCLGDKMKRFTDSIRTAVNANDWYGALSTALTLPDVCGRLENPEKGSKARYVSWYQVWLQPKFTMKVGADQNEHTFLYGEDCYALRCSYLHEGGANIEEQRAKKALEDFHFITPPASGSIHCNQINNTLQLQVDIFCIQVADAVDQWAKAVEDSEEIQSRLRNLLTIHDSSNGVRF